MSQSLRRFLAIGLLLSLACSSSDDDVNEYRVTLEPDKTNALYRGLSGVWEVNLRGGVGRLEPCEASARSLEDGGDVLMTSSEAAPRELAFPHEVPSPMFT